ncbi:MAG TPA: flagellar hook-basal body complex protein FliE [Vitreimonas sp.]|uniref:flagellar hook-basal body complex protein FliE n=1 Tax=Vitreimonas sp. TaxID=3069702 RepID=UPI002D319E60|nr:flagellar hook-basal body complex protein FliE [Vitreimonas sp.]HYD85986.1 flagellar hook-basal body complex protein FliE [Vitreimonas sp.]
MNPIETASAAGAGQPAGETSHALPPMPGPTAVDGESFADVLQAATAQLDARVAHADAMVRAFVVDDTIPIHEVTIALEQARIAVELALEVRTRVIESYREIMNMQL